MNNLALSPISQEQKLHVRSVLTEVTNCVNSIKWLKVNAASGLAKQSLNGLILRHS